MSDLSTELIFQKSDIAELNSLLLFDYEQSLKKYYNNEKKSDFHLRFFKWFDHSKFDKSSNTSLNEFEEHFYKFVFKSYT